MIKKQYCDEEERKQLFNEVEVLRNLVSLLEI
jgi:hypothetical protein